MCRVQAAGSAVRVSAGFFLDKCNPACLSVEMPPLFLRLSGGLLAAGVPGEAGPEEEEKELLAMVRVGLGGKARRGDPERQTAGGYGGLRARSPGAAVAGGELPHATALASPRCVPRKGGGRGTPRPTTVGWGPHPAAGSSSAGAPWEANVSHLFC